MTLYGFYKNSISYIYDVLTLANIDCRIISSKAKLGVDYKLNGILLVKDVNTLVSWLPVLNNLDIIVCVFGAYENLTMIKNITILDENKKIKASDIKKLDTNYIYTFERKDIIGKMIDDSVKGSLFIKLNPIIYKSTTSKEQREHIIKEVADYVFGHNQLYTLQANLKQYETKKNKRYVELYSFIQQHPNIAKVGKMVIKGKNNWDAIEREYPDVKPFEIKYLLKSYEKRGMKNGTKKVV